MLALFGLFIDLLIGDVGAFISRLAGFVIISLPRVVAAVMFQRTNNHPIWAYRMGVVRIITIIIDALVLTAIVVGK